MKVKELIVELGKYNQEADIMIAYVDEGAADVFGEVPIKKEFIEPENDVGVVYIGIKL